MELNIRPEITKWDEQPYAELPSGEKFARASVVTNGDEGFVGEASSEMLLWYRPDGTSVYVGFQRFAGTLDGRDGAFTVQLTGAYDGTTASGTGSVLAGSGTGDLAGITGEVSSASTHADYPHMPITLRYELG
jgi:Protein of unknown function (DUF3224)